MNWSAKYLLIPALTLCVLSPNVSAGEQAAESKNKKEAGAGKNDDSAKKKDGKNGGGLSIPIPVGRDARGIKLPCFNAEGKLEMSFVIESAKRIDEGHLEMREVRLQMFDDAGQADMDIHAPLSILDLETRIVSSNTPVTIRRSDFEITGEKMTFDTKTREGKFTGNTRMLIYQGLSDETGDQKHE